MTGRESPLHPEARSLIGHLGLAENPLGGWFTQVHECRPPRGVGRSVVTVINYLLESARPVAYLHRTSADAIHFFHGGCPLAVVTVSPDGELGRQVLGDDLAGGQSLQVVVAGGTWKAFELTGGPWALISEAVSPGWEATDQEEATPAVYARDHQHLRTAIERFVRDDGTPGARAALPSGVARARAALPSGMPAMGELRDRLGLEPNPEGGWFRQTYESAAQVDTGGGPRPLLNTIYYLLTADSPVGHLHRNRSAITHFHHHGGPATYLLVDPEGRLHEVVLGPDLTAGHVVSFTALGGWWKASHILAPGATDCLISEAVSPGFRYDDHEMASVEGLEAELGATIAVPGSAPVEVFQRLRPYVLRP
ncbi:MAG: cupin domain-containing protein [Actinomycetota bacterium]|nr:cupin domain-containing protein [Actinomycetota bacterium]MDQ6946102.1 cupin domain-containing protein [Actinomycetota bacterium]